LVKTAPAHTNDIARVIITAKAVPSAGSDRKIEALRGWLDYPRGIRRDFDKLRIKLTRSPAVSADKVVLIH
jgi:hypothetical protein